MRKDKKIHYWILIIGLVLAFVFLFSSRDNKPLQNLSQTIVKPFAKIFSGTGYWLGEKISFFSQIGNMKDENERLSNENLELKFKLSQLKEVENENKILRNELDLNSKNEFVKEASFVIGQSLSNDRKIVFLDKGSKDGIREGYPVIVGGGILVGRVSKIHKTTSEVELILDKNNKINAEIQENGIKGIVQGEYGTSAIMDMIPQSAEIKNNQTVITSGLGGLFPRGLLIGYIKDKEMTVDQLFQKASLDLPIQFKNLRMVWVIID